MITLYRVFIRQQAHKDWQEIELDYPTKGMADMAASCAESALKLAGLSFAQASVRAREVEEVVLEGAFAWTGRPAADVIRDAWQQVVGDFKPVIDGLKPLLGGFATYAEQNMPASVVQSRHISLGEQSHKVSVTGMTKCKVCDTRIVAGQTFYFFGADGPYCEACYAQDERRQKW